MTLNKALSIGLILSIVGIGVSHYKTKNPTLPTDAQLASTTAMITNLKGNSGGTGVVLASGPFVSSVLTNAHVCGVVKNGGLVTTDKHRATVTSYKVSEVHDLCLITVNANLEIKTEVATDAPHLYEPSIVSGHPSLLPTLITRGIFSGHAVIDVMTGMKKCTDQDFEDGLGMLCAFLGGIPVIKTYNTVVSSSLIMPGSSGSAAFNAEGKISALVFAGSGQIGYSHMVPVEYINNFLKNELPSLTAQQPVDDLLSKLQLNAEKKLRETCKIQTNTEEYELVSKYCKYVTTDLVHYEE